MKKQHENVSNLRFWKEGMNMTSAAKTRPYIVAVGSNGKKYVKKESVDAIFHMTDGNSKTGRCGNYNLPIEYTCDHNAPCYKDGVCYAENGCYMFASNQAGYSENLNYFNACTDKEFADSVAWYLMKEKLSLHRWFTCGDIPNARFLSCMCMIAEMMPNVEFWSYTKKYRLVNQFCDDNGGRSAIPSNLKIIFSHWMNDDGSYYPMDNPYNFPASEFIPLGREDLAATVTHICPCSDPTVTATCATCDRPCYRLADGESMALMEHSTNRTKDRDKALREAKAIFASQM